jgi:hypothetical protein
MNYNYKIKLHLGKGGHFQHWQIRHTKFTGGVAKDAVYYHPSTHLLLSNCKLTNNYQQALKILHGAARKPCAWIECDRYQLFDRFPKNILIGGRIYYNPKINPTWLDANGNNLDNVCFPQLVTIGRKVFVTT